MSLQGLPGMSQTTRDFVAMVRLFIRDFPELNRILRGEESSDRMIAWALLDALADFNGTPPFIGQFGVEDMIALSQQHLLLRMTVCSLLESVGMLQTRNHVAYSDGGLNVGTNDKTPLIMNWLQMFQGRTEQMKLRVKVSLNISNLLGMGNVGVHSEYWAIAGTYGAF